MCVHVFMCVCAFFFQYLPARQSPLALDGSGHLMAFIQHNSHAWPLIGAWTGKFRSRAFQTALLSIFLVIITSAANFVIIIVVIINVVKVGGGVPLRLHGRHQLQVPEPAPHDIEQHRFVACSWIGVVSTSTCKTTDVGLHSVSCPMLQSAAAWQCGLCGPDSVSKRLQQPKATGDSWCF